MASRLPIRQRELPLPVNALLGALMLGLRRLERMGRAPELDLAVLEETLDLFDGYLMRLKLHTFRNYRNDHQVRFLDNNFGAALQPDSSSGHNALSVMGHVPVSRYLVEIVDVARDDWIRETAQPPHSLRHRCEPAWCVEVGFIIEGGFGIYEEIPVWRTAETKSQWIVEWDRIQFEISIELVHGSLVKVAARDATHWERKSTSLNIQNPCPSLNPYICVTGDNGCERHEPHIQVQINML